MPINAPYFSRYSLRSYSRLAAHPVRELCFLLSHVPQTQNCKVNSMPHSWKSKLYSRSTAGEPSVSPALKSHTPVTIKGMLRYLTHLSSFSSVVSDLAEVGEFSLKLRSECRKGSALTALNIQFSHCWILRYKVDI